MARLERIALVKTPDSAPQYELRVRNHGPGDAEYDIWQMPASATPQVTSAIRLAGLRGRNLDLIEHRVLKRLAQSGIKLGAGRDNKKRGYKLTEDLALMLGLLFRSLAPMRKPRQHAGRGGRHRGHGVRGSRLLARHGHTSKEPAARADGFTVSADGAADKEEPVVKLKSVENRRTTGRSIENRFAARSGQLTVSAWQQRARQNQRARVR